MLSRNYGLVDSSGRLVLGLVALDSMLTSLSVVSFGFLMAALSQIVIPLRLAHHILVDLFQLAYLLLNASHLVHTQCQ